MFYYSKNGMSVSYKGLVVDGRETVMNDGPFFVSIKCSNQAGENGLNNFLDDTRLDVLTNEEKMYINSQLENTDWNGDIQNLGNKICEIYYGMIV